jgi:hypothetical protein
MQLVPEVHELQSLQAHLNPTQEPMPVQAQSDAEPTEELAQQAPEAAEGLQLGTGFATARGKLGTFAIVDFEPLGAAPLLHRLQLDGYEQLNVSSHLL